MPVPRLLERLEELAAGLDLLVVAEPAEGGVELVEGEVDELPLDGRAGAGAPGAGRTRRRPAACPGGGSWTAGRRWWIARSLPYFRRIPAKRQAPADAARRTEAHPHQNCRAYRRPLEPCAKCLPPHCTRRPVAQARHTPGDHAGGVVAEAGCRRSCRTSARSAARCAPAGAAVRGGTGRWRRRLSFRGARGRGVEPDVVERQPLELRVRGDWRMSVVLTTVRS